MGPETKTDCAGKDRQQVTQDCCELSPSRGIMTSSSQNPPLVKEEIPFQTCRGLERTKIWLLVLKPRSTVLVKGSSN
jgi:hypothetical protein